jgi:predicted nucleic acid-binding protein
LLLRTGPAGERIAEEIQREGGGIHAPHLLDAEVGQVLRRYVRSRLIRVHRAETALHRLRRLPMARYEHTGLLERAFELRDNVTVYDGLYLALAEALSIPLLTKDGALQGVPGCRADVVLV